MTRVTVATGKPRIASNIALEQAIPLGHMTPTKSLSLSRFRSRFGAAVSFTIAFSLLEAAVLAPLSAGGLRMALDRWGSCSVGNFEIATFLLSPIGLVALLVVATLALTGLYLRMAGLMAVLGGYGSGWVEVWRTVPWFHKVVQLGIRQVATYILLAIPFTIGVGLAYLAFWSGEDLNRLVITRPPTFWYGAAVAGALVAVYVLLALWLFLREILAIPIILYEKASPATALRTSAERTRGHMLSVMGAMLWWAILVAVVSAAILIPLGLLTRAILDQLGSSPRTAIVGVIIALAVNSMALFCLGVLASVMFAAVVLDLHARLGGTEPIKAIAAPSKRRSVSPFLLVPLAFLLISGLIAYQLIAGARVADRVEVTAHRAGAKHAPENSLSALRRAIADQADWAEIDVRFTADRKLIVIHDSDLIRVSGSPLKVATSTLEELRVPDIGTAFGTEFAGEHLATLEEMLQAAGGQIGLLIELKPNGKGEALELAEAVVNAIRQHGAVDRCRVCGQSYEGIRRAKELEPSMAVGFIAGAALGNLANLDVDFLMVDARLATQDLCDRAAARGIQIHAWTVNDPSQVGPLVDNGVDGIITDDPAAIRQQIQELNALSPVERLLLRGEHELKR